MYTLNLYRPLTPYAVISQVISTRYAHILDNAIHPLSDGITKHAKCHQPSSNTEEPVQVLDILTWYYTRRALVTVDLPKRK
jgi:hypothetical protein